MTEVSRIIPRHIVEHPNFPLVQVGSKWNIGEVTSRSYKIGQGKNGQYTVEIVFGVLRLLRQFGNARAISTHRIDDFIDLIEPSDGKPDLVHRSAGGLIRTPVVENHTVGEYSLWSLWVVDQTTGIGERVCREFSDVLMATRYSNPTKLALIDGHRAGKRTLYDPNIGSPIVAEDHHDASLALLSGATPVESKCQCAK